MDEPAHTITSIENQRRNPDRVNLFLDGAFAFGLPSQVVVDKELRLGRTLSPFEIEELKKLDETGKAIDAAVRLLTSRPRSVAEIERRLNQKGVDSEIIARVVERLRDWRYVDDAEFSRYWIANRESHRPRSVRMLEHELRQKGIDRATVATVIDDAGVDELRGAREIAIAKQRSFSGLEPDVAKRRLSSFLGRRGYGYGVIRTVLDEIYGNSIDDTGSTDAIFDE